MHTSTSLLILLLATLKVGYGQVADDLSLAESRRTHGYFKGYGFGEFGFKDDGHAEAEGQEEKEVSYPVDTKPADNKKQERDNTREEADKGDDEQHKKLFEAFRDFYFKAKKQDEEQSVRLEPVKPVKDQNERKREEPKLKEGAVSYAYSTIEHNQYFKKAAEKKAEGRSDDQDYYFYVRPY